VHSAANVAGFVTCLPLNYGAQGALLWRFAGSELYGPLRRGPLLGVFWGFRFFVPRLLQDLLFLLCFLVVAAPIGFLFWVGPYVGPEVATLF
jgi:hypothetical protein